MLRFLTAGESHGKDCLVTIDGLPANIPISENLIQQEMQKRKKDFGRGGRGLIEDDHVEILSGIYFGHTIGAPITLSIKNKDFQNWQNKTQAEQKITKPRPGHADLAGVQKYGFSDIRPVLERASARETVARVAAGAIFKQFLSCFKIEIASHTIQIGDIKLQKPYAFSDIKKVFEKDPAIRCVDKETSRKMQKTIQEARLKKDTLGGVLEVWAVNIPPGLGSYAHYDQRIDGQLAQAIMSIPSVKGVEIGSIVHDISLFGSEFHDEIFYDQSKGFFRKTNRAGGIEGGITNGMPLVVRVYHKPISTLYKPLKTVDVITKKPTKAVVVRSDICIVPRAGVVSEAMLGFVIAKNMLEKFGNDNLDDILNNYKMYLRRINTS